MPLPAAVLTAPADRRLTAAMDKIAGLTWAAREVTRRRYEKFARLALLGGGAEVTAGAFPELWAVFSECCERLAVDPPGFFLVNRPGMGISLIGEERPVMVMESGALAASALWRPLLAQARKRSGMPATAPSALSRAPVAMLLAPPLGIECRTAFWARCWRIMPHHWTRAFCSTLSEPEPATLMLFLIRFHPFCLFTLNRYLIRYI